MLRITFRLEIFKSMYVHVNVHSELFLDRKPNKYIHKYNIYICMFYEMRILN